MKKWLLALFAAICIAAAPSAPTNVQVMSWSGILAPDRATDWTKAGVTGGIPTNWGNCTNSACNTLCCNNSGGCASGCTNSGQSVTSTTVNAAISGAPNNTVVRLPPGTFTLSDGMNIRRSNVIVRGQGAESTKLMLGGLYCWYIADSSICVDANENHFLEYSVSHVADWTAGFAKGSTQITLSNVTGLRVGNILTLDQVEDWTDIFPAPGYVFNCAADRTSGTNCSDEGGGGAERDARQQLQIVKVVSCGTSTPGALCTSTNVTIDPPINMPNWRTTSTCYPNGNSPCSPQATWPNNVVQYVGLENFTADRTSNSNVGIHFNNAANCWISGVREIMNAHGATSYFNQVRIKNSAFITIQNSYFYGDRGDTVVNYGINSNPSSHILVQNNIIQDIHGAIATDGADTGSVWAYNYTVDDQQQNSVILHSVGNSYQLFEGNQGPGFTADSVHGSQNFVTLFRNNWTGNPLNRPIYWIQMNNRFFNVVGNVAGQASRTLYQQNETNNYNNEVFNFGDCRDCHSPLVPDPRARITALRWGNWDSVTNQVRWCGAAPLPGYCSSVSEVPTGLTYYANPVPTSGGDGKALPASFYLGTTKPSWFKTTPWPIAGPDVTGGNVSGNGGYAYKNPARQCFESMTADPAYTGSSPVIKNFTPSTCY